MRHVLLLCCVLASTACLRTTSYRCADDSSCGGGGACEASGFCSFVDQECTSGRRYSDAAGTLAGTCTGGGTTDHDADINSTIDMQVVDGSSPDVPMAQCPAGYVTITGGNPGHMYQVITTAATWGVHEAYCRLTTQNAYLAIPDDITELTAIDTLVGSGRYWIGVTDAATEGTWLTVLGAAQTYLPWAQGAPSTSGPDKDCVEVDPATHQFNDERCNNTALPAVCECAP